MLSPGALLFWGHVGQPPAPHDLWTAWTIDPLLIAGLLVVAWMYQRGRARGPRRRHDVWRGRWFAAAVLSLAVALVSPLDALGRALASAHMVQHLLLVLVTAPLLALSAPAGRLLRGAPPRLRRAAGRTGHRLAATGVPHLLRQAAPVWLLHAGALWLWHAAVLYDAALRNPAVHALEHVTFLATAMLFWRMLIGGRAAARVSAGLGVLLLFGMALQSALLAVLLTFARTAWYAGYRDTTAAWGLSPLADQQLAGAIMWVPAGMVYLAAALVLLARWVQASEQPYPGGPAHQLGGSLAGKVPRR